MAQQIKLMPDYGCSPLWWVGPEKIGNIDPVTLPLSQETIERLEKMEADYNASLNWDDPANTPDATEEEIQASEEEAVSLWRQLQKELAPDYEVFYFSFDLGKLLSHPSELSPKDRVVVVDRSLAHLPTP